MGALSVSSVAPPTVFLLAASAGWLAAVMFLCCLGRAAARGDRDLRRCLQQGALHERPPGLVLAHDRTFAQPPRGSERADREAAEEVLLEALGY